MKGKRILIGISGSIAAYKIPLLVRLFIKSGAEVKIIMTNAAQDFVSPLVLATLSKNKVGLHLFEENEWENHVALGRWADIFLISPASANTLAKMEKGICDNLLLACYLSATCPIIFSPAMDHDMMEHEATIKNIKKLSRRKNHILIPAEHGELASGLIGQGRMPEPESIFEFVAAYLLKTQKLQGKKALVTAGPTYEAIDPVRFIGNHSSGKMGIAIAEALAEQGCEVHLVLGPSAFSCTHPLVKTISVQSAKEMYEASVHVFAQMDIAVMSAAVADYSPISVAKEKIKKSDEKFSIQLEKTKDILKELGSRKSKKQILVGFALESANEEQYAKKKLKEKKADVIVLNSIRDKGAGFGHDTNKVQFFLANGKSKKLPLLAKTEVAKKIVQQLIDLIKK